MDLPSVLCIHILPPGSMATNHCLKARLDDYPGPFAVPDGVDDLLDLLKQPVFL